MTPRQPLFVRLLPAVVVLSVLSWPLSAAAQDVTTAEVKNFIDPTVMINRVDYSFATNFLPLDNRIYSHTMGGFWAVNSWTGFWADVPIVDLSFPEGEDPAGVGDVLIGWGAVTHENLDKRLTTSAVIVEVIAPSGDPEKLTGLGVWVLAPAIALVFNPTDVFPVYVTARYVHSFGDLGNSQPTPTDLRVRSLELSVQTVHILPKGFFVAAVPTLLVNFNQHFNVFSLAVGGGRAITPSFAWNAAYAQHIAGTDTFNRAFSVQLQYIFGQRKDR